MGLRQATKQKKAERGAEGKSKTDPNRIARRAKSKTQGTKETTLSKDTNWKGNDRETKKLGYRLRIQQGAQE